VAVTVLKELVVLVKLTPVVVVVLAVKQVAIEQVAQAVAVL
jgi:hypothetical protein